MERREKCSPSFLFYSLHPSCSHHCRSCLLFARLVRETGSVLCWIVLWECFGDAITFFIGHYDVAHGELGQNATPIIMKFDTTPTQSQARPQNNQPPLRRWSWRTCSWASNTFTRGSYSLWWQMVVLIHGAWFNFRRFLWNDHVLISGALAKHCPRWTLQKEQRWLRTR